MTVVEGEVEVAVRRHAVDRAGAGTLVMFDPGERALGLERGGRAVAPAPRTVAGSTGTTRDGEASHRRSDPPLASRAVLLLSRRFCCWRQTTLSMK